MYCWRFLNPFGEGFELLAILYACNVSLDGSPDCEVMWSVKGTRHVAGSWCVLIFCSLFCAQVYLHLPPGSVNLSAMKWKSPAQEQTGRRPSGKRKKFSPGLTAFQNNAVRLSGTKV